ncbi:hypothetical protein [Dyadobacter sp. CY326]|uniref:hypothetical protein n=1 Tax=Dyadobacter sp. CY326 TaxID=2907300 RepID=UPI001F440287|nr:hypothetical protein [Dyadobacter sp. CY326]MCE7065011.1 hypothetical protein [Dyadobacter sp. CY326]
MKREIVALLIALFFVQLVACERSEIESEAPTPSKVRASADSADNGNSRIETAKTTGIKQKEPTQFTLVDGKSPYVKWRVVPQQVVENQGVKSIIYFQEAGKYRVFAIDSIGTDTAFIDVEVTNEIYTRPDYSQKIQDNDELIVTPRTFPDSANYLDLQITTKNAYNCQENVLHLVRTHTGSLYMCEVAGVDVLWDCTPGEKQSKATFVVDYNVNDGATGDISITFKGKIFKGTFKRNGRGYTFEWPYDNGITFTTKSI